MFKPRRRFEPVLQELYTGLVNGSITLEPNTLELNGYITLDEPESMMLDEPDDEPSATRTYLGGDDRDRHPRRSIALLQTLAAGIVGVAFALGLYSLARKVFLGPPKPTLLVSATRGRFQYIDGTQEYGLTIIPSSPEYDPIRFCIEAPKDGQFVGEPDLTIPKLETPKGLKPKFDVTPPDRARPNLDCYTLEGVRRGRDKLIIRYIIYSATPLPDSARLRVVPEGNVRVVEQNSR